jgi:uncharacterized protein YjiS (DUF1127 family)
MSFSIQAPNSATPVLSLLKSWIASIIAKREAQRLQTEAVKKLRKLDPHLLDDLDLDRAALWQPRPEIQMLQTPYLVASGSATFTNDDDRRLLV